MKFGSMRNRLKWIIALSLMLIVAESWFAMRHPCLDRRVYRIGYENQPPQHFQGKDGRPTGLAVELIEAAAGRRGIRLEWLLEPESSEAALKSGKVDLWPMMTIRPERKGVVYITDPFRESTASLFVRIGSPYTRLEDLKNSKISFDGAPLDVGLLRPRVPGTQFLTIESPKERLEAVCQDRVNAAYFDDYTALTTLLDGISCAGQGLRIIQVPELNGLLGIGATFEAKPVADAIREEIGGMAADGTLARIGSRWRSFTGRNLEIANELERAQTRERWLCVGIAGAVLLLLVTMWQAAKIRRALASAREATVLKSQFLANMSHEIRTPMNAILGMTALAMDTPDRKEQRDFLTDVLRSGECLLALLNDILDLSKIEAGKLTFELADFDLADVPGSVCALLSEQARAKGLTLACQLPPSLPNLVRGDPSRLRQALVNLVGNAIKFTEKGSVALEAVLDSASDHAISVRFEVRDTGIGISKEAQRRIFESFVQADGSVTRRYGGTGLGLSISRELIWRMGGELRVESIPGRGSTFWFVLPFEKVQEPVIESGQVIRPGVESNRSSVEIPRVGS
jgi:signal transduction histidine kinase